MLNFTLFQIHHFDARAEIECFRSSRLVACFVHEIWCRSSCAGAAAPVVCVVNAHLAGGYNVEEKNGGSWVAIGDLSGRTLMFAFDGLESGCFEVIEETRKCPSKRQLSLRIGVGDRSRVE